MSDYQFPIVGDVLIQPYADGIGPFTFDLSPQLPAGDDIATIVVASSLAGEDSTADLIHGTPTVADNVVSVYFDYPGPTKHGNHKLTFKYTLASGAKDEADFYRVVVKNV